MRAALESVGSKEVVDISCGEASAERLAAPRRQPGRTAGSSRPSNPSLHDVGVDVVKHQLAAGCAERRQVGN